MLQLVVPLHEKFPHGVVVAAGQAPAPLQPAALVVVPLVQLEARQLVPAPGKVQVPSVPQLPAQGAVPPQAVRQQTPLAAQLPVEQLVPAVHVCPGFDLQAPLASQMLVPMQLPGSSAFLMATQVPPAPVQAWQVPHDGEPQQTPSTQLPLVHSVPAMQAVPPAFFATQALVAEQ